MRSSPPNLPREQPAPSLRERFACESSWSKDQGSEWLVSCYVFYSNTSKSSTQINGTFAEFPKVDTFVLVKLFILLPRADVTEENSFKSTDCHLIEVKMFSSVEKKLNLVNMTSRLHSQLCRAPLKKGAERKQIG